MLNRLRVLLVPHQYADDQFDTTYGTNTAAPARLWQPWFVGSGGVGYATVREGHIRALLDPLPRQATVLDLGCGKGRTLCVAGMMEFRQVIGVEYSARWISTARKNLAHLGIRGEVIRADARTYVPPSGPLIVYLYDPFDTPIMQAVANRLRERTDPTWVLYVNPRCVEAFNDGFERLPLTNAQADKFSAHSVAVLRCLA